ncbi:MAG TPA: carboxypeptidase regulatory-like domain-containing protein [Pyrinomonadaceae bacterium]|nr:carboxypeptidase regulatory-like domain-containing protein [Pyrinomonadaceae bacterium]
MKCLIHLSLLLMIVPALPVFCQAQTPEAKPRATVSVSGRVTVDDKPAPGIIVAVNTLVYPQSIVAQTVSDADGKYRLSSLVPGQFGISAVAPTFVVPALPNADPTGRMLNLSADENVEGVDFKLVRGGVITGRVTDADGKPVMDERLTLTPVDETGKPLPLAPQRWPNPFIYNTDDRGIYRIWGLPAGRYKASVGDNGSGASLRSGYYARTYHPDTTDVAKAAIIELSEGGEAKNVDITLGPRSRTYTASGRIIDADSGAPLAGISYAFGSLQDRQGRMSMNSFTSPGTNTNAKGEFRLEGLAPGRFGVMTIRSSFGLDANQPKFYSDAVPFEIIDSDVTDLEVKAQRGSSISGVVITDSITNKAALAGISRLLVSGYVSTAPGAVGIFVNNESSPIAPDGTFTIDGLRPGKVLISVGAINAPELRGFSAARVVANGREAPNRQVELTPGQNISGIRVYIQYGTAVIKGEVKTNGGALPPALMMVSLQAENQERVSNAQADTRGRFVMSGIPAGSYTAVLQFLPLGSSPGKISPKVLRQAVTVTDDSESQIVFVVDLTPKEGP